MSHITSVDGGQEVDGGLGHVPSTLIGSLAGMENYVSVLYQTASNRSGVNKVVTDAIAGLSGPRIQSLFPSGDQHLLAPHHGAAWPLHCDSRFPFNVQHVRPVCASPQVQHAQSTAISLATLNVWAGEATFGRQDVLVI